MELWQFYQNRNVQIQEVADDFFEEIASGKHVKGGLKNKLTGKVGPDADLNVAKAAQSVLKKLKVKRQERAGKVYTKAYDQDVVINVGDILSDIKKVIADPNTSPSKMKAYKEMERGLTDQTTKQARNTTELLHNGLKDDFNRSDCIIALGGGVLGDLSAFISSLIKRGVQFVNIPTTLLAQVDSSIGGKTGVNSKYGKNLIGSFMQPDLVISDINMLSSLPKREIICGYGEILKHSIISDRKIFNYLKKNYLKILKLKSPFIEKTISDSCKIKRDIVQQDEKEKNLRKILNLGHTFAHAYEAALSYSKKLNHGEAVILGVVSSAKFSIKNNILNKKDYKQIINHINNLKIPVNLNFYFKKKDINLIIKYMKSDKKNNSSKINLILIKKIGKVILNLKYSQSKIKKFLIDELIY